MLWIVLVGIAIGLACLVGVYMHQQTSAPGLGKGAGHAGSARYKNRGSSQRKKEIESP